MLLYIIWQNASFSCILLKILKMIEMIMKDVRKLIAVFLKKYRLHALSISFFAFMTVFFSFSIIDTFKTYVPGEAGDTFGSIQRIVATNRAMVAAFSGGFQSAIDFIWAAKLEFFDLKFYGSLLAFFVSDIVAYNIVWISSFFFTAVGAYFLVLHVTKNHYSAILSGILYSFAPVHFAYANGFAGAMHIEVIPLFVLALIRFLEKFTFTRLFLLALSFVTLSLTEHHYGFFAMLFSIPVLGFFLYRRHKSDDLDTRQKIKYVGALLLGVGFVVIAFYDLLLTAFSADNYLQVGIDELIPNSLDLLSFAIPSLHHPFWGEFFNEYAWGNISKVTGIIRQKHFSEISGFVSFVGLFVFAIGVLFSKKIGKKIEVFFWASVAMLMYIFSLGPYLSIFGPLGVQIPLPGLLLFKYLPFMENIRTVGRIFPFALIAFIIVFGYGLSYLFQKISKKHTFVLFGILLVLLSFELIQIPPKVKIERPFFIEQMAKDPAIYNVLNINSSACYVCANEFLYYNAIHAKPTIGGMWFGRPKPGFNFEKTTPLVKEVLYDLAVGKDINSGVIKHDFKSFSNNLLAENNIKYLILNTRWSVPDSDISKHNDSFLSSAFKKNIQEGIENNLDVKVAYQDKNIFVYEVLPPNNQDYVMLRQPLGPNDHYKVDLLTGEEYHEISQGSTYQYINQTSGGMQVDFYFATPENDTVVSLSTPTLKKDFFVTPNSRILRVDLPAGESGDVVFDIETGASLRVDSIQYEEVAHSEGFNRRLDILDTIDPQAVHYPKNRFIVSDAPNTAELPHELGFGIFLSGIVDWTEASRVRDIFTLDYQKKYILSELSLANVRYVLIDKKMSGGEQEYRKYLTDSLGIFEKIRENDSFILLGVRSDLDEFNFTRINFGEGVGDYHLDEGVIEPLGLFASRIVASRFNLVFSGMHKKTKASFKLRDFPALDQNVQVRVSSTTNTVSFPYTRDARIEFDVAKDGVVSIDIVDQNGDSLDLGDTQMYMYDVEVY